jgi:hypothetical protein
MYYTPFKEKTLIDYYAKKGIEDYGIQHNTKPKKETTMQNRYFHAIIVESGKEENGKPIPETVHQLTRAIRATSREEATQKALVRAKVLEEDIPYKKVLLIEYS